MNFSNHSYHALLGLCFLLIIGCKKDNKAAAKPNILFFLVDDQRNDALGCYGNPIIQTPTIDSLANNGIRFTNAFVTTAICMASRATILTGMTSRSNGVSSYQTKLKPNLTSDVYPKILGDNGYRTGFIGKFGFQVEGNDQPENWFDYFKPVNRDSYFIKLENGKLRHETDLDADYAIDFIRSQDTPQPFCLSVSFNAAHAEDNDKRPGIGHYPWPPSIDGMYEGIEMPAPKLSDSTIYNNMPDFLKVSLNRERYFWRWDTPEKYQTNMRAYFRMISGIDKAIERVLKELKAQGLSENTIIVYAADNGYYMGNRGFAGKWSHFEESLRIPMIIYDPRKPKIKRGTIEDKMVLNLDLASTFIDMAGIKVPETYQGESLVPLINEENPENWRSSFFCEHLYPHKIIPKWEGVHTEKHIYARYFEQEPIYEFLHNLEQDPDELINLAKDSNETELLENMRNLCNSYIEKYSH